MLKIEICRAVTAWYCDIHDDGKHCYRQLVPSELGAGDSDRVIQWAAERWPDAVLLLNTSPVSQ